MVVLLLGLWLLLGCDNINTCIGCSSPFGHICSYHQFVLWSRDCLILEAYTYQPCRVHLPLLLQCPLKTTFELGFCRGREILTWNLVCYLVSVVWCCCCFCWESASHPTRLWHLTSLLGLCLMDRSSRCRTLIFWPNVPATSCCQEARGSCLLSHSCCCPNLNRWYSTHCCWRCFQVTTCGWHRGALLPLPSFSWSKLSCLNHITETPDTFEHLYTLFTQQVLNFFWLDLVLLIRGF